MAKILNDFSLSRIKEIIQNDFPNIEIESISPIINGWDNFVVEVNREYIFRFPKDYEYKVDLEIKILNFLKSKITLPIPSIEYIGKSYLYTGYKKIQGEKLSKETIKSLSKEDRAKLVLDIANFLNEFHTSFSVEEAKKMGIGEEDHFSYYNSINKKLVEKIGDERLANFIKETLEEYAQIKKSNDEIMVLYNDLHEDNIAFDIKAKGLNGIFDFGDVMIEDVNREFCYLFRLDPQFMEEVVEKYEELSGRKIDTKRVIIYAKINEMSDLAEYINKPNSNVYKKTLKNLNQWMKQEK
jgi:aminoglycoside 2''-phosphotransferase